VHDLISAARAILVAATNNPQLPSPRPPLATIEAAIDTLQDAQVKRETRTRGTTPVRDVAESSLRAVLRAYGSYVQEQADADPEHALTVIGGSGFRPRKASSRKKAAFTAEPGDISGTVDLAVKAPAKRATYHWRWRVVGTTKWNRAPITLQASTTIFGLPVGEYVEFCFAVVTKTGEGDFSEPIAVLVK
jgi:hypothetical protein